MSPIAAALAFILLVAAGAAVTAPHQTSHQPVADLSLAAECLRDGRLEYAENLALNAAATGRDPRGQAWLIIADSRRQRGQYSAAARAYQMFLPTCGDPKLRQWAMEQIEACDAAAMPPKWHASLRR